MARSLGSRSLQVRGCGSSPNRVVEQLGVVGLRPAQLVGQVPSGARWSFAGKRMLIEVLRTRSRISLARSGVISLRQAVSCRTEVASTGRH
jgi:hypothetical protein